MKKTNLLFVFLCVVIYFSIYNLYKYNLRKRYYNDIIFAERYIRDYNFNIGTRGRAKIIDTKLNEKELIITLIKDKKNNYVIQSMNDSTLFSQFNYLYLKKDTNFLNNMLHIIDSHKFVSIDVNIKETSSCVQYIFWYKATKQLILYKSKSCINSTNHIKYKYKNWVVSVI